MITFELESQARRTAVSLTFLSLMLLLSALPCLTGCNSLGSGPEQKSTGTTESTSPPVHELKPTTKSAEKVSAPVQIPLAPTQRIVVTKASLVGSPGSEKIVWASPADPARPNEKTPITVQDTGSSTVQPGTTATTTGESPVNAIVLKGAPRPPKSISAGSSMVIIGLIFLLGTLGLVGFGVYRKVRGPRVSLSANEELMNAPGLLVKESSIGRAPINIGEESLPTEA